VVVDLKKFHACDFILVGLENDDDDDDDTRGLEYCQVEAALVFFPHPLERSYLLHYQLYRLIPVIFVFSVSNILFARG